MQKNAFLIRYGGIYEHSPWVAKAAWEQGLSGDDVHALIDPMRMIVEHAGYDRQITLLRAHPDLAGKLATAGGLTRESRSEQSGAGLDKCTPEEFERFQTLNATYKDRFRFPFILAVKGHNRQSVLKNFEERVENTEATEFQTALDQVHSIARFRLEALAGETP
ncbi:MAG: 2-oxo-4-hydroxy-4-carboxy-5-ureidoimidazoline decarboxylase [Pseudomonadota bacterium]